MKPTLEHYQSLPYSRRAEGIHEDDEPFHWVVWIDELPGCKTDGATYEEAMVNLNAAFDEYIEAMLEFGSHIPTPKEIHGTPRVFEVTRDQASQILVIDSEAVAETNLQRWMPEKDQMEQVSAVEGAGTVEVDLQQWQHDAEGTKTRMVVAASR